MFRANVIFGIFLRNVASYFSGVLGYIIIVAFVTICALLAFSQAFFANNDASLDQLSQVYPWLLLFFVPAITMGSWANEYKSGTDVLLFSLPASNWEILLGKYLAVAAVYSIALLFSVTQLIALQFLGQPDWSVVISTYYGYWLSGLALLSIGLFASSLTRDSAVAFVLGMVFCAVPVLGSYFVQGNWWLESLSIASHVDQFASGLVSLSSLFYFGSIVLLFLYLNHVVISRRFWVRLGQQFMVLNYFVRGLALVVAMISGYFLLDQIINPIYPAYLDLTSENLYTLDTTTTAAIKEASNEGTIVTIEAYYSDEVPASLVPVKKQLQTLIAQYDRLGGGAVVVREVVVTPTSEEANQAEEVGIEAKQVSTTVGGKSVNYKVYLGAIVRTENGETVLPSFDGTNSIEYEITRAVAALTGEDQKLTVGVLATDMHFSGLEIQGTKLDLQFGRINNELKKFYKLRDIRWDELKDLTDKLRYESTEDLASKGITPAEQAPDGEDAEALEAYQARKKELANKKLPDVLLVAGVSSLDEATMNQLIDYIKFGKPVLLMDDPVPFYYPTFVAAGQLGIARGPEQPRFPQGAPFSAFNVAPSPKASLERLENALGIDWNPTRIVWNSTAEPDAFDFPLREPMTGAPAAWPEGFGSRQNALVFFRESTGESSAFNSRVPSANNLRELLFMYAGTFSPAVNNKFQFIPWVETDAQSGVLEYDQYSEVRQGISQVWDEEKNRQVIKETDVINQWTQLPERVLKRAAGVVTEGGKLPVVAQIVGTDSMPRNVILIADTDFATDLAFDCAKSMPKGLDNVQLLQNAIETLAEDDRFIQLRGRRAKVRPLERIDAVKRVARQKRLDNEAELEKELQAKLADAQKKLDEKTAELQANQDLSFIERLQMTATAASEEQKRFDREMKKAEKEFEQQISELEVEEKQTIERTENWTRLFAVLLPPLPALAIGIGVVLIGLMKQAKSHR